MTFDAAGAVKCVLSARVSNYDFFREVKKSGSAWATDTAKVGYRDGAGS